MANQNPDQAHEPGSAETEPIWYARIHQLTGHTHYVPAPDEQTARERAMDAWLSGADEDWSDEESLEWKVVELSLANPGTAPTWTPESGGPDGRSFTAEEEAAWQAERHAQDLQKHALRTLVTLTNQALNHRAGSGPFLVNYPLGATLAALDTHLQVLGLRDWSTRDDSHDAGRTAPPPEAR